MKNLRITFLCCLDANFNVTKKYSVQSFVEVNDFDEANAAIDHKFSTHSREGWKVEYELLAPIGATYSTPQNSYPMTIHKIHKNGTKVWASYDNYTPNGDDFDYSNDHADDPTQWTEYQLKTFNKNHQRWVRKGEPASSWPIHIGYRKFWWNPSF